MNRSLYQICRNKIIVKLPVAFTVRDIQLLILDVQNSAWTPRSGELVDLLLAVKKSVEQEYAMDNALRDMNDLTGETQDENQPNNVPFH
jgi:hypothetical protein